MDVMGSVNLPVEIGCGKAINFVEFVVINSNYSCVLLGRNFMKSYGNVTFDFANGKIKLGKDWITGVKITKRQSVRVNEKTIVPSRSEKVLALRCNNGINLVTGEFESKMFGFSGVHIARARVTPNINGIFHVTVLNTSSEDVEWFARTIVGNLNPMSEVVAKINAESTCDKNRVSVLKPLLKD